MGRRQMYNGMADFQRHDLYALKQANVARAHLPYAIKKKKNRETITKKRFFVYRPIENNNPFALILSEHGIRRRARSIHYDGYRIKSKSRVFSSKKLFFCGFIDKALPVTITAAATATTWRRYNKRSTVIISLYSGEFVNRSEYVLRALTTK